MMRPVVFSVLVGLCESFLPILQIEAWLPHSGSELLSSLVFFPLLLSLASRSGLADVGYLRVGQILQQLFALLPGTMRMATGFSRPPLERSTRSARPLNLIVVEQRARKQDQDQGGSHRANG
jgi:hypothetical protein